MRFFSSLLILGAIAYVAGFFAFLSEVTGPPPAVNKADAIVVLTGGEMRLDAGITLLEKGYGKRLLISGVDPATTKADLKRVSHGGAHFDCCTDLGFIAADTHGNAQETAQWAKTHGYHSLILVTSNYHMPRSLAELSAAMPQVRLEPYPVVPEDVDFTHWWRNPHTLRLLHSEYAKYVASLVMTRFIDPLEDNREALV
jgi:uncharacterized SAM-binding protein YcdF (DUF218 family)